MKLTGRILILGTAPDAIDRQLRGEDIRLSDAGPLRDDISTDEITPLPILLNYDEKLARYAHTGTVIAGKRPFGQNAIASGQFDVLVAGGRYGKGSSREHAVLAEKSAGIKLVIARSFERIYRQNCDNLGVFTSTDFSLIEKIRRDQAIDIELLIKDREPLVQAILRAGGLLAYGKESLKTVQDLPLRDDKPMNLAQKIVARHAVQVSGQQSDACFASSGFVSADWRFIHEYYTAMAAHLLDQQYPEKLELYEPESIVLFEDHLSYAERSDTHVNLGLLPQVREISRAHRAFARKHQLKDHGYLPNEPGSEGISHAMMTELYALPGQLIAGTDSHTPHAGALGCFSFGVGTTDMANAFVTGVVRLSLAECILVKLDGDLAPGVTAKDVALTLLATEFIRRGGGLGKVFEFSGSTIDQMSIDERATLTNMVAELGGLTGICAPDQKTVQFLKERRNIEFSIEPWMHSDAQAPYCDVLAINCTEIAPMLAKPGDPGNGICVDELDQDIAIHIAYGGSCTAGKREDFDRYHEVALWAAEHGLSVAKGVKLYLQCGTIQVRDYCQEKGYLKTFDAIGAELLGPACGACGQCGPGVSTSTEQVTISAINRNFPGRGGPGQVWLASPPTVLASAIAGKILSFEQLQRSKG